MSVTTPPRKPSVVILGDFGTDIYTHYHPADSRGTEARFTEEEANDINVPSGARLLYTAFGHVFDGIIDFKLLVPAPSGEGASASDIPRTRTINELLLFLKEFGDPDHGDAYRIDRSVVLERNVKKISPDAFGSMVQFCDSVDGEPELLSLKDGSVSLDDTDLMILHDGGGSCRSFTEDAEHEASLVGVIRNFLKRHAKDNGGKIGESPEPKLIVNLSGSLPKFSSSGKAPPEPESLLWKTLLNPQFAPYVCIVCSVTPLRRFGASISRRLSWEQTVEDLATELKLSPELGRLSDVGHLVVRFGVAGVADIRKAGSRHEATLCFSPLARDGIVRDKINDGRIFGKTSMVIACLIDALTSPNGDDDECDLDSADDSVACRTDKFMDRWARALQGGLVGAMNAFHRGYDCSYFQLDKEKKDEKTGGFVFDGQIVIRDIFDKAFRPAFSNNEKNGDKEFAFSYKPPSSPGNAQTMGKIVVPADITERPPGAIAKRISQWQILRDQLDGHTNKSGGRLRNASRVNLALAVAKFGLKQVLNRDVDRSMAPHGLWETLAREACALTGDEVRDQETLSPGRLPALPEPGMGVETEKIEPTGIYVPVIKFNDLTTIDRSEIESLRSIRNLIKNYAEQETEGKTKKGKPISVSVFGPPGSGKSFTVKEIAKSINGALRKSQRKIEIVEYNVAQFRTIEDLGQALTKVASLNNDGKLPLAFFDEFDCPFDGKQLGWLKYFLAPMQDGEFYGARQRINLGRAIFVFAGGVYHSFTEFTPFDTHAEAMGISSEPVELRTRQESFRQQKGPDFISRLRGHIDILPLNAEPGDLKPMIRRAILLRSLIEFHGLTADNTPSGESVVDEDILYAVLTVDRFRHGARSISAILEMCTVIDGRIEKGSLPSRAQLNMHVDAEEFFIRMFRGRFRAKSNTDEAGDVQGRIKEGLKSSSPPDQDPGDAVSEDNLTVAKASGSGASGGQESDIIGSAEEEDARTVKKNKASRKKGGGK